MVVDFSGYLHDHWRLPAVEAAVGFPTFEIFRTKPFGVVAFLEQLPFRADQRQCERDGALCKHLMKSGLSS
jgi:hypothetical protein